MKNTVTNLNRAHKVNGPFIKKIIAEILKFLKQPRIAELEVVFLDDVAIRSLNKKYKKRNSATDDLSFKIDRDEFGVGSSLGEVFISLDTAFRNAGIFKTTFEEETVLYVIHGILHLFGYDDGKPKDRRRMSKKEEEILEYLCKREDLSKVLMPR